MGMTGKVPTQVLRVLRKHFFAQTFFVADTVKRPSEKKLTQGVGAWRGSRPAGMLFRAVEGAFNSGDSLAAYALFRTRRAFFFP